MILYELGVILELKRGQPSDLILLQTTNPFKTSSCLQKHHSHFLVELEVCIPLGVKSSNYFNQIQLFVGLKPNCCFDWMLNDLKFNRMEFSLNFTRSLALPIAGIVWPVTSRKLYLFILPHFSLHSCLHCKWCCKTLHCLQTCV